MEPPHIFRSSLKNGSDMECIQSFRHFRNSLNNGSGGNFNESPKSSLSFKDSYAPSSVSGFSEFTRGNFSSVLQVDVSPQELSGGPFNLSISTASHGFSNPWQASSSTLLVTKSPSSTLKGSLTLLDIPEADSTSIKELPCCHGGQICSGMSWIDETCDPISSTDGRSSHHSDFDTSIGLKLVGATADRQNPMEPMSFSPVSSKVSSGQSPKLRESMRPTIQTDVHQFRDRVDSIQHQEMSFKKPRQLSSPDTASTATSGGSFSADSGYRLLATESCDSSVASPCSLNLGCEQFGFDKPCFGKDEQLTDLSGSHGNYLSSSIHSHPHARHMNDFFDKDLLDFSAAHCKTDLPFQMQGMQASSLFGQRENQFEPNDASTDYIRFDACMTKVIADKGNECLNDHFYDDEEYQALRSSSQSEAVEFFNPAMSMPGQSPDHNATAFTQAQNTQVQSSSDSHLLREEENGSTPPWSADSIKGFCCEFDFNNVPGAQLPIGVTAATPTHDTSPPKLQSKQARCTFPGCNYKPKGKKQWINGNLRRHIKEIHNSNPEDRPVCTIGACKGTFTRQGNLNSHLENKHKIEIVRQKRTRRNTMTETKKS